MGNYSHRGRPPTTLTAAEQEAVLRASGAHVRDERDHVLISVLLGTGLREHEAAALNVIDVVRTQTEVEAARRGGRPGGPAERIRPRIRIEVFKGSRRARGRDRHQWITFPPETRRKLARWLRHREGPHGVLTLTQPLFLSSRGRRLSTRSMRHLWREWQRRAGFERIHPLHVLRHTFASNVYEATGDIILTREMARHSRTETTEVYVHVSDERRAAAARRLRG